MASSAVADSFTSRDEAKRQKQLQEARQAGTAAPVTDEVTGQMINPHNPSFITQAPWYLNQDKPTLQHHQAWNRKEGGVKTWYKRGTKGDVKTKYAKGACENCGATTHTKKDCVERPRQVGARWNGKNLMPDEYVEDLELDWDGKRDRWNGFQPEDYKEIQDEWERVEAERRNRKAAEMEERAKLRERLKAQKKLMKQKRKQRRRQLRRQAEGKETDSEADSDVNDSDTDSDTDSDSDASDDEDLGEKMKDFDKTSSTVGTKDDKLRTTTRNLRIREDTAKYLLNLDVNSAYYDPKSRSMRDDPFKHLKDEDKGAFRGDNFLRSSGDSKKLMELTVFAWDAYKHGEKVHDMAHPTQAAKMFDIYKNRAKNLEEEKKKELMEKYGGEEHLEVPHELIYGQTDNYVEYSRDGRVIKGLERAYVKSKYEEDQLVGNHSSIWGSWFDPVTKSWGFACCHQCMKNAYCIPIQQKEGLEDGSTTAAGEQIPGDTSVNETDAGQAAAEAAATSAAGDAPSGAADAGQEVSSSSSDSDSDSSAAKKKAKGSKRKAEESAKSSTLVGITTGGSASSSVAPPVVEEPSSKLSDKRSSAFGHVLEDITDLDSRKVQEAVEREKKKRKKEKDVPATSLDDERKRKYGGLASDNKMEVTAEELEAYRLTRSRGDDPMAKFL
mmetsp:Transcript_54302/g.115879  ORF Transcript_54302/g.115879 Transcript_54302/m.115879 type:complete len:668 (-) Transcript_54302:50-2053(-)